MAVLTASSLCDDFIRRISCEPATVTYGPSEVTRAAEWGAVHQLLLTSENPALAQAVLANGGTVALVDTADPSRGRIEALTGVCAVLRFPVPEGDLDLTHTEDQQNTRKQARTSGPTQPAERLRPIAALSRVVSSIGGEEATGNEETSEELTALAAIFPDSEDESTKFMQIEHSWSCLVWEQNEASGICLRVDLPAEYPDALPRVRVAQAVGLAEGKQRWIMESLEKHCGQLLGSAMLYDVVIELQSLMAPTSAPAA